MESLKAEELMKDLIMGANEKGVTGVSGVLGAYLVH